MYPWPSEAPDRGCRLDLFCNLRLLQVFNLIFSTVRFPAISHPEAPSSNHNGLFRFVGILNGISSGGTLDLDLGHQHVEGTGPVLRYGRDRKPAAGSKP